MRASFGELKQYLRELLSAFNAHNVKYLVVGGYAVGIYSEPRATKDLDIFVESNLENGRTISRALAAYGGPLGELSPEDFDGKPNTVVQIGVPPLRIDILQRITGVDLRGLGRADWTRLWEALQPTSFRETTSSGTNLRSDGHAIFDVKDLRGAALDEPTA